MILAAGEAPVLAAAAVIISAGLGAFGQYLASRSSKVDDADQAKIDRADYVLDAYHDLSEESAAQLAQCRQENQALRDRLNHR